MRGLIRRQIRAWRPYRDYEHGGAQRYDGKRNEAQDVFHTTSH